MTTHLNGNLGEPFPFVARSISVSDVLRVAHKSSRKDLPVPEHFVGCDRLGSVAFADQSRIQLRLTWRGRKSATRSGGSAIRPIVRPLLPALMRWIPSYRVRLRNAEARAVPPEAGHRVRSARVGDFLERVAGENMDPPFVEANDAAILPLPETAVHAFARAADHVGELALRQR